MREGGALGSSKRRACRTIQEPDELALPVPSNAIAEDEVTHPAADVNGIDLHKAEPGEGIADAGHRRIEQQRAAVKPTGLER